MRKYLYYLGILIALLLTLNSCEKEMMDYEGEDALYFDVRSSIGAHEFFTAVSFGDVMEDRCKGAFFFICAKPLCQHNRCALTSQRVFQPVTAQPREDFFPHGLVT